MSYDFWLEVDTGGPEPLSIRPAFSDQHPVLGVDGHAGNVRVTASGGYERCGNYTSNVGPIWSKCLIAAGGGEKAWLSDLQGKPCSEVAPLLKAAVEWGVEHVGDLRALNPPNGWGDADGAITFLWDIQRMCETHPRATLQFWY